MNDPWTPNTNTKNNFSKIIHFTAQKQMSICFWNDLKRIEPSKMLNLVSSYLNELCGQIPFW